MGNSRFTAVKAGCRTSNTEQGSKNTEVKLKFKLHYSVFQKISSFRLYYLSGDRQVPCSAFKIPSYFLVRCSEFGIHYLLLLH